MAGTARHPSLAFSNPDPPSSALRDILRSWTANVPFPVLFLAGAAVGVLFASLIVAISHAFSPRPSAMMMASSPTPGVTAAPIAWDPLPIVQINPAPPEPEPVPVAAMPATAPRAAAKKAVAAHPRPQAHRPQPAGVPSGNLLTAAL